MKGDRAIDELELKATIQAEIRDSVGYLASALSRDRSKALDAYYGRPYGDEQEGRSQVVSRDVQDTIEWIMPSLLRIFTGTDDFIRFEPVGPEDEEQADQETDVLNHVVMKRNNGFSILHDWFKDAMLSKVGIVTWYWDDVPTCEYETYTGLSEQEMDDLLLDDGVELAAKTERMESVEVPTEQGVVLQEVALFDVRLKRTNVKGECKIENVPPEEFLISRRARSIEESPFCAHRRRYTISDLRKAGVSEEIIESLDQHVTEERYDFEEYSRDQFSDESDELSEELEQAARQVWVYNCYMKADMDGDGIAELVYVQYAGDHILSLEPADRIPFADLCPVRMPHRFYGQSVADLVMDIQRIKTALWRQALDNAYLTNNPRTEAVDTQVNMDDLLVSAVGGVVRVKQPGMINPLTVPDMTGSALKMIEYADTVREERTGVTRYNQGLDPDTLNKTASGISQILAQSQLRIELIARIFAETGIKALFRGVHETLQKNQDKEMVVRLRGKWVAVSPSEWRTRENLTITVGLGTGNRDMQLAQIGRVIEFQEKAMVGGLSLVNEKNVYNAVTKFAELSGLKGDGLYFTDPEKVPPQPDEPSELEMQTQAQVMVIREQMQADLMKTEAQNKVKLIEMEADERLKDREMAQKAEIEARRLAQESELAREKMAIERQTALDVAQIQAGTKADDRVAKLAEKAMSEWNATQ